MAGDDVEQDERTEAPSGKRMAQAATQGDLPIGRDVAPVVGLVSMAAALTTLGPGLSNSLSRLFAGVAGQVGQTPFGDLPNLMWRPVFYSVGICAAGAAGSIVATLVQTKGGFWGEKLEPDLTRLWGGVKLFKVFSKDFALDLGLAIVKVVAVGATAWAAAKDDFAALPQILQANPADELAWVFTLLGKVAKPALLMAAIIAGLDLAMTRWRYFKKMKMTKEEAKREFKEDEGDPLAKGKRKKRHREIVNGKVRLEVPRADALIVNPTHIAIAIRYRRDEGRAPRVTAKGKGLLAEHMRALARENGVPIVEDIPLARLLFKKVKVGREIPAQTFKAVATILAFVYRVTGRSAGAARAG
jgi:flagellar biosynthesis protein FlhB